MHYCDHALSVCSFLLPFHIFYFFSKTAEWKLTKLERKQELNVLYKVLFFGPIGKPRWLPCLWLAETFSTSPLTLLNGIWQSLTGSKSTKSSTNFLFFGPIRKKDGRPASDCLRHFRLLLWNRWMEYNETSQEARTQHSYVRCFSDLKLLKGMFINLFNYCWNIKWKREQRNIILVSPLPACRGDS